MTASARPPFHVRASVLLWAGGMAMGVHAQVPTKCLEIEGVLVDACNNNCPGAQEGENEMFRFITGPAPINLNDLVAQWATPNGFLGWVQNATTASLTAQLNATITSCGWLLEPPGGIIPAGRRVLGITSTNLCVAGNSFAGLTDTLYVIYQAPGNYLGHFKNTNNTTSITTVPSGGYSTRTFILGVPSAACTDTVVYDISQLVNQMGTYGGSSAQNDGASFVASWPGPPVLQYVNFGCQAPYSPLSASITTTPSPVPCGGSVLLNGVATGNLTATFWSGGAGSFSTPNAASTLYTLAASETSGALLAFCAVSICGDTVCANVQVNVFGPPTASLTASGNTTICQGATIMLTGGGGITYLWNTGATTAAISVGTAGLYTVTATNSCGSDTASATVSVIPPPVALATGPLTSCPGDPIQLSATGGSSYTWSTGATTASTQVSQPGTYSVIVSDGCGADTAEVVVLPGTAYQPSFTFADIAGCAPVCATFLAEDLGNVSYTWSMGDGTTATGLAPTHCFASAGLFDVSLSVSPIGTSPFCAGSITVNDLVDVWPLPVASFAANPPVTTIEAPSFQFVDLSSGAVDWSWDFGTAEGDSSPERSPLFTYTSVDCRTVTLHVTSAQGCADAATLEVCVEDPFQLWAPNAFTPDGDGHNEHFGVVTSVRDPALFELLIVDRWGQVLFTGASPQDTWSGAGVPIGIYIWKLRIRDTLGRVHEQAGHVTLVR
ncbi:MAG: gliding motility-associated C-terminal domain-containing protein [Flavobacteriales bacterium]|nr:gliding motility-associated C-terminal domain-containing protein [Flavobacteriales bacterium]